MEINCEMLYCASALVFLKFKISMFVLLIFTETKGVIRLQCSREHFCFLELANVSSKLGEEAPKVAEEHENFSRF